MKKEVSENYNIDEEIPELKLEEKDMEDMENLDSEEASINKLEEIKIFLRNELLVPEFNRMGVKCFYQGQKTEGIPMAELSVSNSFLLKIDNQIKKIPLSDIISIVYNKFEEKNEVNFENYILSILDYILSVIDYVEIELPNCKFITKDFKKLLDEDQTIQKAYELNTPYEEVAKKILNKIV
ncbi:MAG: hypothetical protein PHF86_01960 [Candidatus Nanoarchaeia archaeon]|nr:hypothetical protein [Candidatus Nanoarchaeia archaeon]